MSDQPNDARQLCLFVPNSEAGRNASDAWFWPPINSEEIDNPLPLVLAIGVKGRRITEEEARELCEQRGTEFWHKVDRRTCDAETEAIIARCLSRPAPRPAAPAGAADALPT